MAEPVLQENIISLGRWLQYWMSQYTSLFDVETQAADIAVPTTTPKGDGHAVKVLYTQYTPDRIVLWTYDLTNTSWFGDEKLG